jgi:parvulin-like peptidyl-prolyl isomerase
MMMAAYVLLDVYVYQGPLHRWVMRATAPGDRGPEVVAKVHDEKLTLREFQEALRDHLWRRGGTWAAMEAEERMQVRRTVMDRLINERLVRDARLKEGFQSQQPETEERAMFVKQFERAEDFEARLSLRGLSLDELDDEMQQAIDDQAWIELKIEARVKQVSDKDVTDWLREKRASMAIPPVYGVAHIYLTTHDAKKPDREVEIREIHRKLTANEATFEQLASQYSEDERSKKTAGELGWCARGRMPDDFMNVVEKLEEGETSEPVETKLGWHVIRLIDRKPGRVPAIDEVRREVTASLRDQSREAAVSALIAGLREQCAESLEVNQGAIDVAEPP